MKNLFRSLAALAFASIAFLPLGASAQQDSSVLTGAQYKTCSIVDATVTICKNNGAAHILGFYNDTLSAQTVTVTCYDNISAASGTIVLSIGQPLGISQSSWFNEPGKKTTVGLTCQASGALAGILGTGNAIEVFYR